MHTPSPMVCRRCWLALALAVAACSAPGDEVEPLDDGGKADRAGAPAFIEVDPAHTSAAFRRYIAGGLAFLEASESQVARLTARAIRDGKVRVDELADLTCWDFQRVRGELPELDLAPGDFARLHDRDGEVAGELAGALDGYMWSGRVYVARGLSARRLGATLVHEVNHVINRSDVGYYEDLPTSAFLHEYRAFYAESLFEPGPYEGVNLVDYVIENYDLDRSKIPADILANPLTPILLPTQAAWAERDVSADVEEQADCSQ